MAIEIIDGFKLSTAVPVDSRIVASGSIARNTIPYKYEGLRVFDTSDSIAYVWMNNNWINENKSSLSIPSSITPNFTSGSGYKAGQVLKVLNTNNQLTNSNILEVEYLDVNNNVTSKTVAINHTSATSVNNPFDSQIKLDVNGTIKANSFIGIGSNLTSLDATKITVGKLNPITQLLPGVSNYVLRTNSAGTGVEWTPASSLSSGVGISSAATSGSTSLLTHYLTFVEDGITTASGLKVYRESGQPIGVIPQNGQIVVKDSSSVSSPPYSFKGDVSTGIYRSGAGQVSISSSGNQRFEVNSNSVRVPSGTDATSLGLRFGGSGTSFTQNNHGFYYAFASSVSRIGIVANGNEVVRVMSNTTTGQGYGNVSIYGNGNTLSLYGVNHTYIQFFKTGADNPNTGTSRSAYIGFESATSNNFNIHNEVTGSSIKLISTGEISLNAQSTLPSFTSIYSNSSGFGATIDNSNSSGSGLQIKHKGQGLKLIGTAGVNYISFFDVAAGRTFYIGHGSAGLGNNHIIINHDLPTGVISTYIGTDYRTRVSANGVSIGTSARPGTFMRSVYHGWFHCTYNTSVGNVYGYGPGITSINLYGGGMSGNGFSYNSGSSTGGNNPTGYIKLNTPAWWDVNKVIIQVTPRYAGGVEQYMIFTTQVNSATDINIYFKTAYPSGATGWAINNMAFNISIFEIVQ